MYKLYRHVGTFSYIIFECCMHNVREKKERRNRKIYIDINIFI